MPNVNSLVARLFRVPLLGPVVQFAWQQSRRLVLCHGTRYFFGRYLRSPGPHKLHLGAGGTGLPGWFNTDLFPERWPTVRLDATKPFPFSSGVFHFVFSEHMIEHVPLVGGRHMLAECFRTMAPGGRIRLATPDLANIVRLHTEADLPAHRDYLAWSLRHNRLPTDLPAPVIVINSLFHDHGHRFLFDEASLAAILRSAGFTDIRRYPPGVSPHPELSGVETHQIVIGEAANNFETLVLEACKP